MKKYYSYQMEDMILRDHLATDRTVLANERTFLAYLRTSLSLIVAGGSFIKFFEIPIINMTGYLLIPLGFYIGVIGLKKYTKIRFRLKHISKFEAESLDA